MNFSRTRSVVARTLRRTARIGVSLWTLGVLVCIAAIMVAASLAAREAGWRGICLRASVFGAFAALWPMTRRAGLSGIIDAGMATGACLLELLAGSTLTQACIGVAASAAGWSLGRNTLALTRLWIAGRGALNTGAETAAVAWFAALQRTPPERFDWQGLERWMRAHPSHRDAYERVESVWFRGTEEGEGAWSARSLLRRDRGLSRVVAVTRLGVWLAPSVANRCVVFTAAVLLSAATVYG